MSKVKLSQLKPIREHILVTEMNFGEQVSKGGIVLRSDDGKSEGVKPRWCKVCAVGHEQAEVKVGEWLLMEHGRWTRGLEVIDDVTGEVVTVRRVDYNGILGVSDEKPNDAEFGNFTTAAHGSVHNPEDFVHMR